MRLLTDTCAAIKLLAFEDKLFKAGVLSNGDLILHPRVFNETKRWPSYKKEKYKQELECLGKIRATSGLRPSTPDETERLEAIIIATMDEIGSPIGSADRDQLCSAIYCEAEIVTNDSPFARVAEALEVNVHSAERIVIEAYSQSVINREDLIAARKRWAENGEKKSTPQEKKELDAFCQ